MGRTSVFGRQSDYWEIGGAGEDPRWQLLGVGGAGGPAVTAGRRGGRRRRWRR